MQDIFIHDSSFVDEGAQVGTGTRIWHFCHISSGAEIGKGCNIGQNVYIATGVKVGNNVKIQNNVSVYAGVTIEEDAFLGPSMVFTNVVNPRSHVSRKAEFQATLVGKGATIGANATILCGVTLGKYAFVGAGAVITRDIPDHALVYGNPARIQGWMCQCGERLRFQAGEQWEEAHCERCASHYTKQGDLVRSQG